MMTFYRARKRSKGIPLVPMIDIVTILLLFFTQRTQFMQAAGPPQNALRIEVPKTRYLQGEPSKEDHVLLELADDGRIALNGALVEKSRLRTALAALLKDNPKVKIQCSAAKGAPLGSFVEIWDMLTASGVDMEQFRVRIDREKTD